MIDLNRLLYNYQMPSDGGGGSGDTGGDTGGSSGGGDGGFGGDSGYGGYGGFAGGGSAAGISGNEQNAGMGGGAGGDGGNSSAATSVAMSNNPAHLGIAEAGLGTNMYDGLNTSVANGNFGGLGFSVDTSLSTDYFSFSNTSFSVNHVTKSSFDLNFDSLYARAYGKTTATVEAGTIASHLAGWGLSVEEAITAEALGKVAIGMVLGASTVAVGLSAIQALGQIMGVNGMLSKQEYDGINEAVAVASLMIGTINTMRTISTVTSNFGYMTAAQKAIAIAIIALSIKNTISEFQALSEKYGVSPNSINVADIANINLDSDGNLINNYAKVLKVQAQLHPTYGTKPNEWQIVDKMAGSVMYDIFMAGGNFNSVQDSSQLMASVGSKYNIPNFAKQSLLQEDYLSSLDMFKNINKIYEPNINFDVSINNMV